MTENQEKFLDAVQRADEGRLISYLNRGIDPNFSDSVGHTPLMIASINDYANIAKLLLKRGAKKEACDSTDWTAREHALFNGSSSVLKLLNNKSKPYGII